MAGYFDSERKDLKQCKTETISDCGLKLKEVKSLIGNPAGIGRQDQKNPKYHGKVSVKNGVLHFNLSYLLTGHIDRAKAGLNNIIQMFSKAGVIVSFTPTVRNPDRRIHGANFAKLVEGLKLCDCDAARYIGGWAPHHTHYKWPNALLLNPHLPEKDWPNVDAHEFGHKLGLKHKVDGGIMDYPPKRGKDRRTITASDINRIKALYRIN